MQPTQKHHLSMLDIWHKMVSHGSCDLCNLNAQLKDLQIRFKFSQAQLAHERCEKENALSARSHIETLAHAAIKERDDALLLLAEEGRKEVGEIKKRVSELETQCNALRHENFELRGGRASSNLAGAFPTHEEILKVFVDLNEQVLVNYILDHSEKVEPFAPFLANLVLRVRSVCDTQFNARFAHLHAKFLSNREIMQSREFADIVNSLKGNLAKFTLAQEHVVLLKNLVRGAKEDEKFENDSIAVAEQLLAVEWKVKLAGLRFARADRKHYRQLVQNSSSEEYIVFDVITHKGDIIQHGYCL